MKYSATFSLPSMMVASPSLVVAGGAAKHNPMRVKKTMSYKNQEEREV